MSSDFVRAQRARRVATYLLLASVLVWVPGGFSRFVLAKLLLVCLALIAGCLAPRLGRLPRSVLAVTGVGAVLFVLAAIAGESPLASLVGRWPRYEGLPVVGLYAASAWLGARLSRPSRRDLPALENALALLSVVLLVFSVLDLAGVSPLGRSDLTRDGSVLGNATDQGVVAAMLAVALLGSKALTPWLLIGGAASIGTLAVSGSRASMVAALAGVALLVLFRRRRLAVPAAVALTALVVAALAVPGTRDRLLEGYTITSRLIQWRETLSLAADHPLLGVGPSGYLDAIGRYEDLQRVGRVGVDQVPDSAHSWPLQALTAGGVPLLVVAVSLAVLVLVLGWRAVRRDSAALGLLGAVFVYGTALLANFTTAGTTCLAAFLVGVLVVQAPSSPRCEPRRGRVAIGAIASGAVLVLLLASVGEVQTRRGVDAARAGDVRAAVSAFDAAAGLRPLDPDTAMIAAQALAAPAGSGSQEAATASARFARASLRRTPDSCSSGVALGVAQLSQRRLEQAVKTLDHVVVDCPLRPAAYIQRGLARFGLRDVAGARADLRRARRLDPRNPAPRRILRIIRQRVG